MSDIRFRLPNSGMAAARFRLPNSGMAAAQEVAPAVAQEVAQEAAPVVAQLPPGQELAQPEVRLEPAVPEPGLLA